MTSNSPHDASPSGSSNTPSSRPQSQVWGLNQTQLPVNRGALAPISTSFNTTLARPGSASQTSRHPWSPSATRLRSDSISSTASALSPPAVATEQSQPNLLPSSSNRSRPIGSSVPTSLTSSAATQASGTGGGGGGGGRLPRASPSISQSNSSPIATSNPGLQSAAQSGQYSKIVIAQLFLLLSTIKEDKDRVKWTLQADQIRTLVQSNSMEVFTKYFRRLLLNNAAQIWNPARTVESTGSYGILVSEMHKITRDPQQAAKIVESVDSGEGEIFKDFDLSTFLDHFKLSPTVKFSLAMAFKKASKSDLKIKADAILSSSFQTLIDYIANFDTTAVVDTVEDLSTDFLAILVDRLAQDPPKFWNSETQQQFSRALQQRYHGVGLVQPAEISSTLLLFELLNAHNPLVRLVRRHGPKGTDSLQACKAMLESLELRDISYEQVASSILFMVIARDDPHYDPHVFIAALREHRGGQRLDWQDVVLAFDRNGLKITTGQFKAIFSALMPLAREYENFDIQLLWGGDWRHAETQLSFVSAFLSLSADELDANQIPRLRKAFTMEDFQDASELVKSYAKEAVKHPFVSIDATQALFNMVFRSSDTYNHAQSLGVIEHVINAHMVLFVASVSAVPKPWGALQDQAMRQLITPFLTKATEGHEFAFHLLWKRDKALLADRIFRFYEQDSTNLLRIFEHAQDHGWLEDLIRYNNEMSLDLAALAHGKGLFDIQQWLQQLAQAVPVPRLSGVLCQFLKTKAEADVLTQREHVHPETVRLTVKTVHAFLEFLGDAGRLQEEEVVQLHRSCLQAYPRLINYGEGYDAIIDANGEDDNAITAVVDAKMQEHYKQMYSGETQIRDIIQALRLYKTSQDAFEQDLFASMIFGLFDEYNCFREYPMDALATTAVLFGSIINFNLLSRIALQAGLAMVLEAVRDSEPGEPMHTFGLEALLQFQDRLEEWKMFSEELLKVPGLRGTAIHTKVEQVVNHMERMPNGTAHDEEEAPLRAGISDRGPADGNVDDFLTADAKVPDFTCLSVDPPLRPDIYEDPAEEVEEMVLFTLNNVSERNMDTKIIDLKNHLRDEHHQWFANYLVEHRVKPQPNFRQLYIDLLEKLDDKILWAEVLRETYVSTIRMLNSDIATTPSNHLGHLRNLSAWLGSMTLARNQPIKHRNISFRDLLIEAHDTQRLPAVITFICKVLDMAKKSLVFRPPCAWTMEVVQILVEIYQFVDLKTNSKFEIEVLCRELGLDHKAVEPSDAIRSKPLQIQELMPTAITDGLEAFTDLPLMNFNARRALHERFSPAAMMPELSELSAVLKHNYPLLPVNPNSQNRLRETLAAAVERAVSEIIAPVVERSVTIAAISASQLIAKDFALEPNESRYEECAHTAVRALAGSLALVTCKEPLRASMGHNVRMMTRDFPELALPEGSILMFVNDNLEAVCNIVEKAAETASVTEIDSQIEDSISMRRERNFVEPQVNRWAYYMPEPYRPSAGGLNHDQMAIYEDFGRSVRGSTAHISHVSQDSARQMSDLLQDHLLGPSALPNSTDIVSRGRQSQQRVDQLIPSLFHNSNAHRPMNGYMESQSVADRISKLVSDLYQAANQAAEEDTQRSLLDSTTVQEAWLRLQSLMVLPVQAGHPAITAAQEIFKFLYAEPQRTAVVGLFARLLREFCIFSESIAQLVYSWFTNSSEEQLQNLAVTVEALKMELLDIRRLDMVVAKALQHRKHESLSFFADLVDSLLLSEHPSAWRSELCRSMDALAVWSSEDPQLSLAQEIKSKLQDTVPDVSLTNHVDASTLKHEYLFEEWMHLVDNGSSASSLASFIHQLHGRNVVDTVERCTTFFRTCLDASIMSMDREEARYTSNLDKAYLRIDALARMIVLTISHQGAENGITKPSRVASIESILSLIVLVLANHYRNRIELFNQKAFFKLFSSLLCEIHSCQALDNELRQDIMFACGRHLSMLEPQLFPGFAFAWISLISHRALMPVLLRAQEEDGRNIYCLLLVKQLAYVGDLMKSLEISFASQDMYRGTLRVLLVLHHDFPEFLAEYHFQLLNHIPIHCTQMRSLVISASPTFQEQPDPFTDGLKVDRVEATRRNPTVRGDIEEPLRESGILIEVDEALKDFEPTTDTIGSIIYAICHPVKAQSGVGYVRIEADTVLLDAIVLYVAKQAQTASAPAPLSFSASSSHAKFLEKLAEELHPETRYHFISAIANQLRYPNSYTHYFSYAIFHLFHAGQPDSNSLSIQQQIIRVLLERLIASRPHPWGLLIVLSELLKNRIYRFWDLPFIKDTPDFERTFGVLFQQMGAMRPLA